MWYAYHSIIRHRDSNSLTNSSGAFLAPAQLARELAELCLHLIEHTAKIPSLSIHQAQPQPQNPSAQTAYVALPEYGFTGSNASGSPVFESGTVSNDSEQ